MWLQYTLIWTASYWYFEILWLPVHGNNFARHRSNTVWSNMDDRFNLAHQQLQPGDAYHHFHNTTNCWPPLRLASKPFSEPNHRKQPRLGRNSCIKPSAVWGPFLKGRIFCTPWDASFLAITSFGFFFTAQHQAPPHRKPFCSQRWPPRKMRFEGGALQGRRGPGRSTDHFVAKVQPDAWQFLQDV